MSEHPGFLQAIYDEPDEDVHRLVYADWLEEQGESAQSELIRVQCELARLSEDDAQYERLRETERHVLEYWEDEWLDEMKELDYQSKGYPLKYGFRRGFVETVECSLVDFMNLSSQHFRLAPTICHADLLADEAATNIQRIPEWYFSKTRESPHFRRLTSVSFRGRLSHGLATLLGSSQLVNLRELILPSVTHEAEEVLEVLLDAPYAAQLRRLDLEGSYWFSTQQTGDPLCHLLSSDALTDLRELTLTRAPIRDGAPVALRGATHLKNLERLTISRRSQHEHASTPPPQDYFTAGCALALARAQHFSNLKVLDLTDQRIGDDGVIALARSKVLTKLERLILPGNGITDEGVWALAQSKTLTALKRVNLEQNQLQDPAAREALRARLGGTGLNW